jgi:hypothetical protein
VKYLVKLLPAQCGQCGFSPATVKVGITSLGELAFLWDCKCGNQIVQRIDFEKVIAQIPPPPLPEVDGWTDEDRALMAKAHISLGG